MKEALREELFVVARVVMITSTVYTTWKVMQWLDSVGQ